MNAASGGAETERICRHIRQETFTGDFKWERGKTGR